MKRTRVKLCVPKFSEAIVKLKQKRETRK